MRPRRDTLPETYIALLHPPVEGSTWGVTFPDLPGCTSGGDTLEEASSRAREALAGHIAAMVADGDTIPPARRYHDLLRDADFMEDCRDGGALPVPVELIEIAAPKERVNIMIDRGTLRRVDEAARAQGASRSAFIENAAKAALPLMG